MALNARSLLYGRIVNTYRDRRVENHPRVSIFTAEMQVYCIIKGEITEDRVNISEAGYVPGRCYKSILEKGQEYVVVVYPIGDLLCTVDDEISATEENMEKVTQACDLDPRYPHGITEETAIKKCPSVLTPPDCISNDHLTTTEPLNYYNQPVYESDYETWQYMVSEYYEGRDDYPLPNNSSPRYRISLALVCVILRHILSLTRQMKIF